MASQPGQDQDNLHLICVCLSPNCLFYVLVQQRGTHFEPAGDILICAKGIGCKYQQHCAAHVLASYSILLFLHINVPAILMNQHLTDFLKIFVVDNFILISNPPRCRLLLSHVAKPDLCLPVLQLCVFMFGHAMHGQRKPALFTATSNTQHFALFTCS